MLFVHINITDSGRLCHLQIDFSIKILNFMNNIIRYSIKISTFALKLYLYVYEEGFVPGVAIKDIYDFNNKDEERTWEHERKQYDYMERANAYYRSMYLANNTFAAYCRDYAELRDDNSNGRWGKDVCDLETLGYAGASGHNVVDWIPKKMQTTRIFIHENLLRTINFAHFYVFCKNILKNNIYTTCNT